MYALINKDPELLEKKFSPEEVRKAASLISDRTDGLDEDLLRRALNARFAVRVTGGKIPVINNEDSVIGMASSMEEARKMSREDNETRDSI